MKNSPTSHYIINGSAELLSLTEAAEYLGESVETLRLWDDFHVLRPRFKIMQEGRLLGSGYKFDDLNDARLGISQELPESHYRDHPIHGCATTALSY